MKTIVCWTTASMSRCAFKCPRLLPTQTPEATGKDGYEQQNHAERASAPLRSDATARVTRVRADGGASGAAGAGAARAARVQHRWPLWGRSFRAQSVIRGQR